MNWPQVVFDDERVPAAPAHDLLRWTQLLGLPDTATRAPSDAGC
ncbi:MAG TPA: hypothetical protein VGO71_09620 [Baekduia sp.]|nr:hypothetical protein [Baekduia sp.]